MALQAPSSFPQVDTSQRKGRRRVKWPTYARVAYYENRPRKVVVAVDKARTAGYVARATEENRKYRRTTIDRIYLNR